MVLYLQSTTEKKSTRTLYIKPLEQDIKQFHAALKHLQYRAVKLQRERKSSNLSDPSEMMIGMADKVRVDKLAED